MIKSKQISFGITRACDLKSNLNIVFILKFVSITNSIEHYMEGVIR